MQRVREFLRDILRQTDLVLLALCCTATAYGILMIYSATRYMNTLRLVLVQTGGAVVGIILFFLLSLVDMTLVGGLLVMVMFSGYENFVSQLDINEGKEKLSWLGKMDATSLKNKVAASIVAISSIHLLRVFMDAKNVPDNKLMWYVIIHLTFVLSAFVMGWLDNMSKVEKKS